MSTPDFYLCDICGEKVNKKNRLYVVHDNRPDGAGGSEDWREPLDLCPQHMAEVFRSMYLAYETMKESTIYERGKKLLRYVKSLKKAKNR